MMPAWTNQVPEAKRISTVFNIIAEIWYFLVLSSNSFFCGFLSFFFPKWSAKGMGFMGHGFFFYCLGLCVCLCECVYGLVYVLVCVCVCVCICEYVYLCVCLYMYVCMGV